MEFDDLAARALDTTNACGATYADIRFEVVRSERVEVRNGVVATLADGSSTGYGIRVLIDGAWGFAASADLGTAGVDRTARRAVETARASAAIARLRIGAPPPAAYADRFVTPMERDPAGVPLGERVALLLEAEKLLHAGQGIAVGRAWLDLWRTDKFFFSTIGSRIEQQLRQTGCGLEAMAVGDGEVQVRSYPGDMGLYNTGGWEIVEEA
ncbi:MAG TPA: DNA gyrase modulator, partial [Verrucomicrobiae bacterium]|nr:DNA gyrase modulator [Verrucomicrobiae bacterium]